MKIRFFNQDEGYYIPSFMYINISEHIDMQEFEENSSEIKGTFIHEYCHYLQDISTTYGYNKFICVFQDLLYGLFPNQYEQQKKELQWNKDFLSLHTGTEKLNEIIICINSVQIINNPLCEEIESEMNSQCVIVGYNGCKEFEFGNHCIIEGMAYLVEKQLYDVREPDNEFPFNMLEERTLPIGVQIEIYNDEISMKKTLNGRCYVNEEIKCCLAKDRVVMTSMFLVFVLKAESEKRLMKRLEEYYIDVG